MRLLAKIAVACTLLLIASAQKYPYGEVSLIFKLWSDPPILQKHTKFTKLLRKVIEKSLLFYEAERSGPLPKDNRYFVGPWMCLIYFKVPLSIQMTCLLYLQGIMARRQWNEWWRKYSLLSFSCKACNIRLKSSESFLAWWVPSGTRGLPRRRGPRKVWISYGFNDGQSS